MNPPEEEPPPASSLKKLLSHYLDELPPRMFVALAFIAFFFAYGLTNSLIKLTGRDIAAVNFPLGAVLGALAALAGLALAVIAWRRQRRHR